MKTTTIQAPFLFLAPLTLGIAACSHGGIPASDKSTEETLEALGVDTTETPRVDHNGEALPEDYGPLGPTFEVEKLSELVLLGFPPSGSTSPISVFDMKLDETSPATPPTLVTSLSESAAPWTLRAEIPNWSTKDFVQNTSESAMATGDFTGDGRQDIALYAQDRGEVAIWGIEAIDTDEELVKLRVQPVTKTSGLQSPNPVTLPVNPDSDTTVLQLVEHRFLMTEPIVMAVLAAAPGNQGIGQNTDACTSEYGEATSSTSGSEWDVSVSSGFIVGAEFKAWGTGFEIKGKLQKHHGLIWNSTYAVTTSIAYETGPLEDTVVCLVTPYDHYTYKVLADADPAAVGQLIYLSLPREPISLQVERSYYNDSVGSEELKIDASVFSHTPGQPGSYMSAADKDAKLAVWGGMQTGPASVGQGMGSTTLGIAVAQETTYSGSVGSIDADHFVDERFEFGLMVYTQSEPSKDQAFDVINYWVE